MVAAPGIEVVKEVKKHPKGGYAVGLEYRGDAFDQLVEHLAACGFRAVI